MATTTQSATFATRALGNSDLQLTSIGYGAWAIGGGNWEFAWGSQDDAESIRTIQRALDSGLSWIDTAAIVADAPHPDNARRFVNFLMDAKVAAENSNAIHFPNGNAAAQSLTQEPLTNAAIYPRGAQAERLIPERLGSDAFVRLRTRMWTRFRTGQ